MAITFQEKSNLGKNAAIVIVLVASFFAVIFLIGYFLRENILPASEMSTAPQNIDMEMLQDPRLAEMDFFPEITVIENNEPRLNPFVEYSATSSENMVF